MEFPVQNLPFVTKDGDRFEIETNKYASKDLNGGDVSYWRAKVYYEGVLLHTTAPHQGNDQEAEEAAHYEGLTWARNYARR